MVFSEWPGIIVLDWFIGELCIAGHFAHMIKRLCKEANVKYFSHRPIRHHVAAKNLKKN